VVTIPRDHVLACPGVSRIALARIEAPRFRVIVSSREALSASEGLDASR